MNDAQKQRPRRREERNPSTCRRFGETQWDVGLCATIRREKDTICLSAVVFRDKILPKVIRRGNTGLEY